MRRAGVPAGAPGAHQVRAVPALRVSFLIPARNAAGTLEHALRSVAWQTFPGWEAVVVDDGSTDATLAVARRFADPRIRALARPHRGLVAALSEGLAHCRGDFVARMDADDVSHPERLALQVEALEADPTLVAVGCLVRSFPSSATGAGMRRYVRWQNSLVEPHELERDLFVESPLVHPSVVFRREAVERAGGYCDRGWPEDYDLWLRLWEAGGRFRKVPRTLLYWRDSPSRLTRTHPMYALEAFRRLKVDVLLRTHLAGRAEVVVWGAGRTGKRFARELRSRGVSVAAFVDVHPGRLGQEVGGSPVVHPDQVGEGYVLVALGQPGARDEVRRRLLALGRVELRDFLCVA